jgi:polysaccharide deacetylase family protein (PEP-CTERM system associated)
MRNVMTIDVEDYFHVAALAEAIDPGDWEKMEYRAECSTGRLLRLFADHDVHATFFVLGWVARHSPQLVREIRNAGHEVASHGMSHKLIYEQTPEEFARETSEAKSLLENLLGEPVHGYRAATYSITRRSLWALDIIHDLGFSYDSSIFPVHHDMYGIPDAPLEPGPISTPSGARLIEFPISTVELLGLRAPIAGGGYFRLFPYWVTRAGLRRINRHSHRPFVFYLHPWELDPNQPVIEVRWRSRFRHYRNLGRTEERLERLIREFHFTTMHESLRDLGLLPADEEPVGRRPRRYVSESHAG